MSLSKYHARTIEVDGVTFDSRAEANRYLELILLGKAGEISDLELQPKFPLIVNGVKICTYFADFRYKDLKTGKIVTEDVKGFRTRAYSIKKKLMKALYDVDILETGGSR